MPPPTRPAPDTTHPAPTRPAPRPRRRRRLVPVILTVLAAEAAAIVIIGLALTAGLLLTVYLVRLLLALWSLGG